MLVNEIKQCRLELKEQEENFNVSIAKNEESAY